MKAWPLDARFCCFLAGCVRCECAVPSADTALHRPDSGLLRTERDEETGLPTRRSSERTARRPPSHTTAARRRRGRWIDRRGRAAS